MSSICSVNGNCGVHENALLTSPAMGTEVTEGPNYCPSRLISFILMPPLLPGVPRWASFNAGCGSRTPIGQTKSFLELCCSLSLFLPNSPFFPLSYHSCEIYTMVKNFPSHSAASLPIESLACLTLFWHLLL